MAKRFTDSEKWSDPWFSDLPSKYKLFYLYLLDSCDHAGIWKVNFKIASFMIGEPLEHSEVKRILQGRVRFIDDNYWFIEKFIKFQYNGIKSDKVGISVTKVLEQNDLYDVIDKYSTSKKEGASKGLGRGLLGTKDKDKDKAKAKDKVKDMVKDKDNSLAMQKTEPIRTPDSSADFAEYETHHEKMSNFAKQYGAMDGLTPREIEHYIVKRGSDDWEKPQGNIIKRITQTNIRADMLYMKRQGWLREPKAEETENTFNGGVMN